MIDLNDKIDVFIITNGRSTFEYSKKSVDTQKNVSFRIVIIRDMGWQEAHIELLKSCKSKFALRVDDDMLLHPFALEFMWKCIKNQKKNVALRGWRLWEPWSNKICKGIKVYNVDIASKIGFKLDKLGKIDKPFTKNAIKNGFKIKYSDDVVAIHSCGQIDEHMKYWKMRGEANKGITTKMKWAKPLIAKFSMTLEEQYNLNKSFMLKENKRRNTQFSRFINEQNTI